MRPTDASLDAVARNTGFSALVCTSLGLLLLEACFVQAAAKPSTHVIIAVVGATLAALMYRRIAIYLGMGPGHSLPQQGGIDAALLRLSQLGSAVLLMIVGYVGAKVFATGSATTSGLFTLCLLFFPWSRVAFCRMHLPASWLMIILGMVAGLLTAARLPHPLVLGVAIWMLWISAASAWMRFIFIRRNKECNVQAGKAGSV
ncbi:hypothetical protein IA69_17715 [Massilia sp. JS1662]|nr:hypothetical protein [Massilia sp. JS1662]KGF80636.1 hypothetical protein IA69_17715 [Massilia sp. JS1662]